MNSNLKKQLYESIMWSVAKTVKKSLNEAFFDDDDNDDFLIGSDVENNINDKTIIIPNFLKDYANCIIIGFQPYDWREKNELTFEGIDTTKFKEQLNKLNTKAIKFSDFNYTNFKIEEDGDKNWFTYYESMNIDNYINCKYIYIALEVDTSSPINFRDNIVKLRSIPNIDGYKHRIKDTKFLKFKKVTDIKLFDIYKCKENSKSECARLLRIAKSVGKKDWTLASFLGVQEDDPAVAKLKTEYSYFKDLNITREGSNFIIEFDPSKVYTFTRGKFMRSYNGRYNISIKPSHIYTLELRSGMSMEDSGSWPELHSFSEFINIFKDCTIDKLIINRVYIDKQGFEECLYDMDITKELKFYECRLIYLERGDIDSAKFKNAPIEITSDKATFKKYIV